MGHASLPMSQRIGPGRGREQHVGAGRRCDRRGHGRGRQNRSGGTECQDGGNDDGSLYAHDLSRTPSQVSGLPQPSLARTAQLSNLELLSAFGAAT